MQQTLTVRRIAAVPDEINAAEPAHGPVARPGRRFWADPPAAVELVANGADSVTTLAAVSLPSGGLLLLPARPDEDDIHAIRAAARPLQELLADRGLLPLDERSPS